MIHGVKISGKLNKYLQPKLIIISRFEQKAGNPYVLGFLNNLSSM